MANHHHGPRSLALPCLKAAVLGLIMERRQNLKELQAMEQPASLQRAYYMRVKEQAAQRIATAVWRVSPPTTRAEVTEALAYALHHMPAECLADVILDAAEWRQADNELKEDAK